MSENKNSSYLHGAAILTAGVIIVKVIGAIYKIPIYNILGTEGTSYFTVAYNIYAVLLAVATGGLPVAMSKMVSAATALDRPRQVNKIFTSGRLVFFAAGMIGTLIMLLFPNQIAQIIGGKGNDGARYSIMMLAPALVCICMTSAYRGYFQGHSNMIPTTVTQILEALCKLVFGLSLATILLKIGKDSRFVSAGAITGVTIGTVVALLFMVAYKSRDDKNRAKTRNESDIPEKTSSIVKRVLQIGIPITLSASILNILNLIDTALILNRLQSGLGLSKEVANSLQGSYGMVQTLYNLPSAIVTPITVSFMPSITAFLARKEYKSAANVTESGMKITNLIAMPAGVGLSCLAMGIVPFLYPSADTEAVGLLAIMGITAILVCMMLMSNSILQANGYERYTVYTVVIGGIIKIAGDWILIGTEGIGVYGVAIAGVLCYFVINLLNLFIIVTKLPQRPNVARAYIKPILCSAVMGVAAYAFYNLIYRGLASVITTGILRFSAQWITIAFSLAGAVLIAIIVYVILIFATGALTSEDIKMLPKGEKLAQKLKKWVR